MAGGRGWVVAVIVAGRFCGSWCVGIHNIVAQIVGAMRNCWWWWGLLGAASGHRAIVVGGGIVGEWWVLVVGRWQCGWKQ